jgi:hypothetical protein
MRGPRAASVAVAALLLVSMATACSSGGFDDLSDRITSTTSTLPFSPSTTEPPLTGQALVVAEQGVSTFPDPFEQGQTLGGYGVVLQNPNLDVMAVGVHVRTRVLDAAGTELLVDNALLNGVMPGARMAVGRTLIEPIQGPTQLEVTTEVGGWLRPASTTGGFSVESAVTEPEPYGGAVTRLAVRSSWPFDESGVDVTAVYRAADGRILAAESTTIELLPAAGVVLSEIRLLAPIPGLATTEVLVGRGFDAQTEG